jgi:hypothetical protein
MIRKSGNRFSEKIMLKKKMERDDDSKKSHPALEIGLGRISKDGRGRPWTSADMRGEAGTTQ